MKHINTFNKGLDKDTNVNSYSNTSYPYALNLRILSDISADSGTLTNMEKSKKIIQVPIFETIVGTTVIRENLIIFTKSTKDSVGKIFKVPFSILLGDAEILLNVTYLLTRKNFDFGNDVQIVARYETPTVQKIYWVDGKNPVRFANIESSTIGTQELSKFNIVSEVELSNIELDSITNGTLPVGIYQYTYCLYDSNGAETGYSAATPPIPLSESSLSDPTSKDFRGSNVGEISGKGIKINISNVDSRFTGIRIARLFYATQESTPEVSIVYEGEVNTNITFTDSGGVILGTLILEDIRYIPNIFSAKTLETKNDFLFAGNIVEDTFDIDFDARAYRFRNDAGDIKATVWSTITPGYDWWNGEYINVNSTTWDVPENYNCINPYNILDSFDIAALNFKYKSNGTTLGGEGKYIEYQFDVVKERPIDDAPSSSTPLKTFTNNYKDLSNPIILNEQLGYQRGEIYRFGVVFYDKYGRQSFVKWIGDIRMLDDSDGAYYSIVNESNQINDLPIRFNLKPNAVTYLQNLGIVGWQIVRAERTYADATVKDCGYISRLANSGDKDVRFVDNIIFSAIDSTHRAPKIVEYISPETVYNKNNNTNYDRLDLKGCGTRSWTYKTVTAPLGVATPFITRVKPDFTSEMYRINTLGCLKIDASKTLQRTNLGPLGASTQLTNVMGGLGTNRSIIHKCVHGTTLLLRLESEPNSHPVGYYVRRRSYGYPYGGASYDAVKSTVYYPCSPVFNVDSNIRTVWGGDCYIGIFEYMRGLCSKHSTVVGTANGPSRRLSNEVFYALVETKINLMYTVNPRWSRLDSGTQGTFGDRELFTDSYTYNAMWETAGVHEAGQPEGREQQYYEQDYNLYTYNPVYSLMDKSKVFFIKPDNLLTSNNIDTRIYRTTKKFNGEISDSWTKFPINNQLDVDTKYGALTKLLTFKDRLFYFQEKGIGIVPIQEREVVTSQTGNATTLGVGGVMERYDYITTTSGTNNLNGISTSNTSLYYIDTLNKKLCRLGENVEFISDLKGIKSDMSNKPFTYGSVLFNPNYNEIWFYVDGNTYIFNEYTGYFISEVSDSFIKNAIINNKVLRFSSETGHRLDEPNTARDWELHVIVNPNNIITNRYDSITFGSTKEDANIIPIDYITLSNRVQESFMTKLNSSNVRHRFRNWIFNGIRDDNEMRMYDSYLKMVLKGGADEKVKIYDILTNYTPINNR